MEEDLSQEKVFDMIIQLKGISLILPENGVLYKWVNTFRIVSYLFVVIDILLMFILILIVWY